MNRRTLILVATILGSSLAFLDAFIVALALPTIREQLHFGFAGQQWIALAYALALVALYLIAGALGDRFGRRRVFVAAVVAFAVASAAAGLAQNVEQLIAARAFQGIAAAFVSTNSLALIRAFYKEEAGRAIGIWTGATALATILGPPLGGLLVQAGSWRLIFFINLPLAVVSVVCILLGPREDVRTGPPRRFDLVGAALIAGTLSLLTLGLERAQSHGAGGVWWAFAGFAASSPRLRLVGAAPGGAAAPLQLFRERTFAAANLETLLVYGALQSAGPLHAALPPVAGAARDDGEPRVHPDEPRPRGLLGPRRALRRRARAAPAAHARAAAARRGLRRLRDGADARGGVDARRPRRRALLRGARARRRADHRDRAVGRAGALCRRRVRGEHDGVAPGRRRRRSPSRGS